MNKAEQVKQKIKIKFRTVARFAAIAGLDALEVRRILNLNTRNPVSDLYVLSNRVDSIKDVVLPGEMSNEIRKKVIKKINENGGVLTFNRHHPEFAVSTVYRVISGKVKRIDRKAAELIKHLGL